MGKKTSFQEAEVNTERRLSHFDNTLCEGHLSFHFKVGVNGGGKSFISANKLHNEGVIKSAANINSALLKSTFASYQLKKDHLLLTACSARGTIGLTTQQKMQTAPLSNPESNFFLCFSQTKCLFNNRK